MNQNMDELISYACVALTLAGRFSKVLLAPEACEGRLSDDVAKSSIDGIIKDKYVTSAQFFSPAFRVFHIYKKQGGFCLLYFLIAIITLTFVKLEG
jgi:hypothetical protein